MALAEFRIGIIVHPFIYIFLMTKRAENSAHMVMIDLELSQRSYNVH